MQSIGERLEEARKRKGISIREAAEATKIRSDYLHKFESNQYDIKLPEIYVRGFLRTYSNYLKLPAEKIISDYNGLGLGDAKQRGLNREVYGRMDLGVTSARDKNAPPDPTSGESAPPMDTGPRNPATFIPQPSGSSLDKNLLIKAGILVGGTALVVILISWLILGRDAKPANNNGNAGTVAAQSGEIWVRPAPGENTLTIVAVGPLKTTVTQLDSQTVLFSGTIPQGEVRAVPYKAKLRIVSDKPENLRVRIGNIDHELRAGGKGPFLPSADIDDPSGRR